MRNRPMWLPVMVVVALLVGLGAGPARAQAATDTTPITLQPTAQCPQGDIDTLQRVITFVRSRSWADEPDSAAFKVEPDTANCRVVLQAPKLSDDEAAALQRGGENRLTIEETKDRAEPSRLPLLLWVVFGGAGLVFVFFRYGRR